MNPRNTDADVQVSGLKGESIIVAPHFPPQEGFQVLAVRFHGKGTF